MALSVGALVVFALIGLAIVFFVTELIPPDMTASRCLLLVLTGVSTLGIAVLYGV
ncbi:MAG: hypothetical protein V5A41_08650 [Haloarculaceae archaeon]